MINITGLKIGGEVCHFENSNRIIKSIEDQQMHFNFIGVILLYYGCQHVSAIHVTIFMVVSWRTRIQFNSNVSESLHSIKKLYDFWLKSLLNNKIKYG
jgi:hypothetical protein